MTHDMRAQDPPGPAERRRRRHARGAQAPHPPVLPTVGGRRAPQPGAGRVRRPLPGLRGRAPDRAVGRRGPAAVRRGVRGRRDGGPQPGRRARAGRSPHLVLFDRFAAALPAADAPAPGPAADALADTYLALAEQSPVAAIAGLAAYETQAAAIAATKGDGLRRWYGVDADGTTFWDVHATMDVDHGDWAVEALALLGADEAEVTDASRRAADAWWALLDEREAEGMATV